MTLPPQPLGPKFTIAPRPWMVQPLGMSTKSSQSTGGGNKKPRSPYSSVGQVIQAKLQDHPLLKPLHSTGIRSNGDGDAIQAEHRQANAPSHPLFYRTSPTFPFSSAPAFNLQASPKPTTRAPRTLSRFQLPPGFNLPMASPAQDVPIVSLSQEVGQSPLPPPFSSLPSTSPSPLPEPIFNRDSRTSDIAARTSDRPIPETDDGVANAIDIPTDATPEPTPDGVAIGRITPDSGQSIVQRDAIAPGPPPSTTNDPGSFLSPEGRHEAQTLDAPPVEPVADIVQADAIAPDTIAPDTIAPDTIAPDTMRSPSFETEYPDRPLTQDIHPEPSFISSTVDPAPDPVLSGDITLEDSSGETDVLLSPTLEPSLFTDFLAQDDDTTLQSRETSSQNALPSPPSQDSLWHTILPPVSLQPPSISQFPHPEDVPFPTFTQDSIQRQSDHGLEFLEPLLPSVIPAIPNDEYQHSSVLDRSPVSDPLPVSNLSPIPDRSSVVSPSLIAEPSFVAEPSPVAHLAPVTDLSPFVDSSSVPDIDRQPLTTADSLTTKNEDAQDIPTSGLNPPLLPATIQPRYDGAINQSLDFALASSTPLPSALTQPFSPTQPTPIPLSNAELRLAPADPLSVIPHAQTAPQPLAKESVGLEPSWVPHPSPVEPLEPNADCPQEPGIQAKAIALSPQSPQPPTPQSAHTESQPQPITESLQRDSQEASPTIQRHDALDFTLSSLLVQPYPSINFPDELSPTNLIDTDVAQGTTDGQETDRLRRSPFHSPTPQLLNSPTPKSDRPIDPSMGYAIANPSYEATRSPSVPPSRALAPLGQWLALKTWNAELLNSKASEESSESTTPSTFVPIQTSSVEPSPIEPSPVQATPIQRQPGPALQNWSSIEEMLHQSSPTIQSKFIPAQEEWQEQFALPSTPSPLNPPAPSVPPSLPTESPQLDRVPSPQGMISAQLDPSALVEDTLSSLNSIDGLPSSPIDIAARGVMAVETPSITIANPLNSTAQDTPQALDPDTLETLAHVLYAVMRDRVAQAQERHHLAGFHPQSHHPLPWSAVTALLSGSSQNAPTTDRASPHIFLYPTSRTVDDLLWLVEDYLTHRLRRDRDRHHPHF